jgi:hypothetical protein
MNDTHTLWPSYETHPGLLKDCLLCGPVKHYPDSPSAVSVGGEPDMPPHSHDQCRNRSSHSEELCRPKSVPPSSSGGSASGSPTDPRRMGVGGAPTRATTFPDDAKGRKAHPVASGVADYFPDALVAVSHVSYLGNEQHNPGQPLHWARSKSGDEADALMRHFLQRGTLDSDGVRHSAKMVWRALALLQKEIEAEKA